jgi:membrane-associated phospholipid phosphatase
VVEVELISQLIMDLPHKMDVPHERLPQVGRLRQVRFRLRLWWPAKLLGITLGMTVFFIAYFRLLQHPLYPVTIMPLTAVDRLIGFWPESLPLYFSLWFYVSLVPALMIDRRELVSYGLAALGISVVGLATFLFWPTAVPPLEVDWSQHPGFAFLKSVDATGNACPSLHVAFAVFTAVWFDRLIRQMGMGRPFRALNGLWCTGILYSTLATRQHVSLDVLAGAALGATVAGVHLYWLRTHQRPLTVT